MKRLIITLALATTTALASPSLEEVAASPETFAVCKTVDIATTAIILSQGGVENNSIVAWSLKSGYAPLVFISIGIYWAMVKFGNRTSNTVVNTVTCSVALHNVVQML
jgi:hypothetical protein